MARFPPPAASRSPASPRERPQAARGPTTAAVARSGASSGCLLVARRKKNRKMCKGSPGAGHYRREGASQTGRFMGHTQGGPVLRWIRELAAAGEPGGQTDARLLERFAGRRDEAAFALLVE